MATKLSNGWTVSYGNTPQNMSKAAATAIMNRVATEDMTANELFEEIGGAMGMNAGWSVPIFDQIKATDMVDAYKQGVLPSTADARAAISSGEYVGSSKDYMNEVLSDIFGLEYTGETGFVSKGAKPKVPEYVGLSQKEFDMMVDPTRNTATNFNVDGTSYVYDPKTGSITRKSDGQAVSGLDEINEYAKSNYYSGTGGTGSSVSNPGGVNTDTEDNSGFDGYESFPYTPGTGTSAVVTPPTTSAPVLPSAPSIPQTPTVGGTGGYVPSTGIGQGTPSGGADVLGGYLTMLGGSSDFADRLNASRENLENKYGTLFEDLRGGDYTKKPYYQTILDSYGIAGDAASNDASASGAAANSGNLDSYAAANARRQELAYKNAAHSAALNAYNADIGNMLKTLSDLGVNVNDLYATWAGELDSQRGNAVNAYLGQLGAETDRYVSDNALAGDKYKADAGITQSQIEANTQQSIADKQSATDRYLGDLSYKGQQSAVEAEKEIARLQAEQSRILAEMESADTQKKIELEKELAQVELEMARIAADADRYAADLNAQNNKYATDREVEMYLEGLKQSGNANNNIEVKDPTTEEYEKALEIYRTQGSSALEKYIDSLARGKQDLVRDYVEKHAATISNDDLYTIAAYTNYAMKQGGRGYSDATKDAWLDYVAKNPEMNTDQNKDFVMAYLDKTFATN